jgi:uncharacterized membrane protein (GlpM family)
VAHDLTVILIKAIAGGTLVVLFALLGSVLRPKWLAGLFSAAPSIAVASLIVTVFDKGDTHASIEATGMIFGAVGFVVFASLVRPLLAKMHAVLASAIASLAWIGIAVGGYLIFYR